MSNSNTGWLALNLAQAATAANLSTLAASPDWRVTYRANAAQHDLEEARIAGEGGSVYRERARRHIVGLAGQLRALVTVTVTLVAR
jgi:hypothetical protein